MRCCCRVLGALVLAVAVLVLGAWTTGVIVSDRWVWSQYLRWLPAVIAVPGAAGLWVIAAVLWRAGRGRARWAGRIAAVWLLAAIAYVALWELRLYRLPLSPGAPAGSLRIVHWNATQVGKGEVSRAALARSPDVAVMVNVSDSSKSLAEAMNGYRIVKVGDFAIASRVPVLRWGMMFLGIEGLPLSMRERLERKKVRVDPGRAMFMELDAKTPLGKNIIVWVLDMPSEPRLSRWAMAHAAAGAIAAWGGPVMTEGGPVPTEAPAGAPGFPAPDIVVGDFNTTRGADSLSVLMPGMHHAFDQAGAGYAATWPRMGYRTPIPLVHIDHMFSARDVRAVRYEVVNPGCGYHMMQVGDFARGE